MPRTTLKLGVHLLFYDRLQILDDTIVSFHQAKLEQTTTRSFTLDQKAPWMYFYIVFYLVVLQFFTLISIAITAVYFVFKLIGELNFGYHGERITRSD